MANLHYALVGPGRVGASLATWISRRGGRLTAWARGSNAEAGPPCRPPGRRTLREIASLPVDLLLVCVPDRGLTEVSDALGPVQARVALHVSGSQTAEVLAPLRGAGAAIGSFHPLWAFPCPQLRPPQGLAVGIDGDPAALVAAHRLTQAFGGVALEIPARSRLIYHLAATLAAGGVATVAATAAALARAEGLPEALGEGFRTLAGSALSGLSSPRLDRGFTGPVARGDVELVQAEWRELARYPEFEPLVRELAAAMRRRLDETPDVDPGPRAIGPFS